MYLIDKYPKRLENGMGTRPPLAPPSLNSSGRKTVLLCSHAETRRRGYGTSIDQSPVLFLSEWMPPRLHSPIVQLNAHTLWAFTLASHTPLGYRLASIDF